MTIHIQDLTCKCNQRESHLSDFLCSISESLLCQPSRKNSSRFYLVNVKLNHSDILFLLWKIGKLGSLSLPVFGFCFCISCTSLTVNSNMPPSDSCHSMFLVCTTCANQHGLTQGSTGFPEWHVRMFCFHKLEMRWDDMRWKKCSSRGQWIQKAKDVVSLPLGKTCFFAKQCLLLSLTVYRSCCRDLFRCCGCQHNITCAVGGSYALWRSPGSGLCSPEKWCCLIHTHTSSSMDSRGRYSFFYGWASSAKELFAFFSKFGIPGKKQRANKGTQKCNLTPRSRHWDVDFPSRSVACMTFSKSHHLLCAAKMKVGQYTEKGLLSVFVYKHTCYILL